MSGMNVRALAHCGLHGTLTDTHVFRMHAIYTMESEKKNIICSILLLLSRAFCYIRKKIEKQDILCLVKTSRPEANYISIDFLLIFYTYTWWILNNPQCPWTLALTPSFKCFLFFQAIITLQKPLSWNAIRKTRLKISVLFLRMAPYV